jgi:Tol biopolymer transport system component
MAAWSPDGRRIAFVQDDDGNPGGLFVMNADGSAARRLGTSHQVLAPRWTTDGKRVVFTHTDQWGLPGPGITEVHIIQEDGTRPGIVTNDGMTGGGYIFALFFIPK